jgi:hypothetical protein
MSPTDTYLEYLLRERAREREQSIKRARDASKVEQGQNQEGPQTERPRGLRRRLARKLVSLGLRLDPQGPTPS